MGETNVFEYSSELLDRAGGCDVVVVAGHEDAFNTPPCEVGHSEPKDFRRITAAAMFRRDRIADVPTLIEEETAQLMTNRHTPDHLTVNVRNEPAAGDTPRGDVKTLVLPSDDSADLVPRAICLEEHEIIRGELFMEAAARRLIVWPRKAKRQGHSETLSASVGAVRGQPGATAGWGRIH